MIRPIPGCDGYFASDEGRIFSTRTGVRRELAAAWHKGYLHVFVRYGTGRQSKRREPIHKLVLLAFAGSKPSTAHECRHLDGNAANNTPGNLAWGTRAQNVADAIQHGTHACLRRGADHPRRKGGAFQDQGEGARAAS